MDICSVTSMQKQLKVFKALSSNQYPLENILLLCYYLASKILTSKEIVIKRASRTERLSRAKGITIVLEGILEKTNNFIKKGVRHCGLKW